MNKFINTHFPYLIKPSNALTSESITSLNKHWKVILNSSHAQRVFACTEVHTVANSIKVYTSFTSERFNSICATSFSMGTSIFPRDSVGGYYPEVFNNQTNQGGFLK